MEVNIESIHRNRAANIQLTYGLTVLCLFDWFYKLFQSIIHFQYLSIIDYFAYLFHLWKVNMIITTLVLLVCVLGIPKFISSLQKGFDIIQRLWKSIMKRPIITNIPLAFYLFIIFIKFSSLTSNFFVDDRNSAATSLKTEYWQAFRQSLTLYRYSTLITLILFVLGVYTLVTNRLTQQISKQLVTLFSKKFKLIQNFLTTPIPTPMSIILLLSLNFLIHSFPNISFGIYRFLVTRSFIWTILFFIGLYQFSKWYWPTSTYDVDLTGDISLNDVSRLNQTQIFSLFYPRTINDLQYLIGKAISEGRTISLRGQAHTMGGQTLPSKKRKTTNYVCDLKYLNRVEYDETTKEVVVEAGATWTHVIKKLNFYGRSPVVMQSYCTFSVAGTISVNAHGITSDDAMYESVLNIEYLDINGNHKECNRDKDSELFSLMIGGYGLFGIITRLRLKTVANVKTSLEYIRLQSDEFANFYEEFLNDSTIEIKIARVDLVRPNNILMFVFRQESGTSGTVADLADEARVMHPRQHLIYTYLAQHQPFRRIRFAFEKILSRPLDLTYSTDRNTTMYESAKPMALLYQPLTYYDDTFILQEYFIPKQNFSLWFNPLKSILKQKYSNVFLLNLTIRFVKKDQFTFLSYTKQSDSFAFVFYFRIKRNSSGDQEVQQIHQKLIQLTFQCQGTFYLPYRQHYSYQQIIQSYPIFDEFFQKKLSYDPIGLFSNDWYEHYLPQQYQQHQTIDLVINHIEINTEQFQIVEQRRMNSFEKVILDEILREKFRKFLRTVFNAEPVHVIFNYVNRAVRNPSNQNDHQVYQHLQHTLKTRQFAFIRNLFALFKQLRQLRLQIEDIIRQQMHIFKHLGYCGKIKDIVSFGDGGRCIKELRQILKIKDGKVYIVNTNEKWTDILERNNLLPIGTFIPYDFSNITDVPIPSESIDLVVCYMGLHHLPQQQLSNYLKMIHRILQPNGLFLFREHHAYEQLKPLLDVAHMVFNVVTGVDYESEINEIRAFRTIEQWRSLLRENDFVDTFIYDEQEDDPTDDIMMVFRKPNNHKSVDINDKYERIKNENFSRIISAPEFNYFRPCEWLVVRIIIQFALYLNHTPFNFFPYTKYLLIYWALFRTEIEAVIRKFGIKIAVLFSPGFYMNFLVGVLLSSFFLLLSFFSFLIRLTGLVSTKQEYEQLILEKEGDNEDFDFTQLIDSQIDEVQKLKEKNVYAVRIPRHVGFTSILKKIAFFPTKFDLLMISNQMEKIQVELTIHQNEQCVLWLKQRSNIEILFEYKHPVDQTQTSIFLLVNIKHLFSFLRDCKQFEDDHSLTIVQIFDYYDL